MSDQPRSPTLTGAADPMPILYLRARAGAGRDPNNTTINQANNDIITNGPIKTIGQYTLDQISGYTGSAIGAGRKKLSYVGRTGAPSPHGLNTVNYNETMQPSAPSGLTYYYPYDAYPYLRNDSLSGPQNPNALRNDVAKNKDGYILVSDITSDMEMEIAPDENSQDPMLAGGMTMTMKQKVHQERKPASADKAAPATPSEPEKK